MAAPNPAADVVPPVRQVASLPPEPFSADVAITWHHHSDLPTQRTRAVIMIRRGLQRLPMLLSEIYEWDMLEGYWVSTSSHLRLKHQEFQWAAIDTLLRSAP